MNDPDIADLLDEFDALQLAPDLLPRKQDPVTASVIVYVTERYKAEETFTVRDVLSGMPNAASETTVRKALKELVEVDVLCLIFQIALQSMERIIQTCKDESDWERKSVLQWIIQEYTDGTCKNLTVNDIMQRMKHAPVRRIVHSVVTQLWKNGIIVPQRPQRYTREASTGGGQVDATRAQFRSGGINSTIEGGMEGGEELGILRPSHSGIDAPDSLDTLSDRSLQA
jgi:hypothetical protein